MNEHTPAALAAMQGEFASSAREWAMQRGTVENFPATARAHIRNLADALLSKPRAPVAGERAAHSDYRRGVMEAFHLANMAHANRQGRTAEETCAHIVQSVMTLANGGEACAPVAGEAQRPTLAVWYGSMPESNGKSNWTAILYRKDDGLGGGVNITLDRSEYPDRVRYEADRVRYLIGEIDKEPWILDYDAGKCDAAPQASVCDHVFHAVPAQGGPGIRRAECMKCGAAPQASEAVRKPAMTVAEFCAEAGRLGLTADTLAAQLAERPEFADCLPQADKDGEAVRNGLHDLVEVLQKRYFGRMPDEVQKAFDAARTALSAQPGARKKGGSDA